MIIFDCESDGLQPGPHQPFMFQFYDGNQLEILYHPKDQEKIQTWFDKEDNFCAWNIKFDIGMALAAGYKIPSSDKWHDGMILAHLANHNERMSLKHQASLLIGDEAKSDEKAVKDWLAAERRRRKKLEKKGFEFHEPTYKDVPSDIMEPYAANDVIYTEKVCKHYSPIIKKNKDLSDLYQLEQKVTGALFDIEQRGLPIDVEAANQFRAQLVGTVEEDFNVCAELAGNPEFNARSPKQIIEALLDRGITLDQITKSVKTSNGWEKKPSSDSKTLKSLNDELAQAILKYRSEAKILGTYLEPMLDKTWDSSSRCWKYPHIRNGRIHPNFRQFGTVTGRLSCSDPNLQNWPRDDLRLRYLITPSEGKVLVTADLDAIELCLFAEFVGEGAIKDAILNGHDLHQMTAIAAGFEDRQRTTGIESARQQGKTLNFSMIYGGGIRTVSDAFNVSRGRASSIIKRYHQAYPEVERLNSNIEDELKKKGFITSPWGRRFQTDNLNLAYKFTNYLVQGTAADIMKVALVRLFEKNIPVISTVHDEIIVEVDEDKAENMAEVVKSAMTEHSRIKIPLSAEASIVKRWSEAKDPKFIPNYLTGVIK